jgi:hypothetical protein
MRGLLRVEILEIAELLNGRYEGKAKHLLELQLKKTKSNFSENTP